MRILGLDWGQSRIGAAVSDPDGKIAFPLDKIIDSKQGIAEIKKIVDDLTVEKILIGNPKSLSGGNNASSDKVAEFVEKLKSQIQIDIELQDERFSSVSAGKTLADQGLSERKQRVIKDNIAAQLILQQYLDTKNN